MACASRANRILIQTLGLPSSTHRTKIVLAGRRAWLAARSDEPIAPPPLDSAAAGLAALEDAPGSYVLMR